MSGQWRAEEEWGSGEEERGREEEERGRGEEGRWRADDERWRGETTADQPESFAVEEEPAEPVTRWAAVEEVSPGAQASVVGEAQAEWAVVVAEPAGAEARWAAVEEASSGAQASVVGEAEAEWAVVVAEPAGAESQWAAVEDGAAAFDERPVEAGREPRGGDDGGDGRRGGGDFADEPKVVAEKPAWLLGRYSRSASLSLDALPRDAVGPGGLGPRVPAQVTRRGVEDSPESPLTDVVPAARTPVEEEEPAG